MAEIKHYLQKITDEKAVDLEEAFNDGKAVVRYSKCVGLNAKGKRKNAYTESFAESDELRVWMDKDAVTREATKITMTVFIVGENLDRGSVFDKLYDYMKNGVFFYWDTARLKKIKCILVDEFKPSEEMWYGSNPYFSVEIPLQNLWGESKTCDENGILPTENNTDTNN